VLYDGANLVPVGKETHERLVSKFAAAAAAMKVGYGLRETSEMGPVATKQSKERVMQYVDKGTMEGAKLVLDGRKVQVEEYPEGFYVGPTIFDGVDQGMAIAKEEIFGPVASVTNVETLQDAIDLINENTNFGNMACIFTTSGGAARHFRREVNAGNVGINLGVAQPPASFPFGGRRESFFGVLHAQVDTVDFFTDKKITVSRW